MKFKLLSIKELEFSYKNPVELIKDFDKDNFFVEAKISVNYKWNIEKNLFGVIIDFFYISKNKNESTDELLKLSLLTSFSIDNLKDIFTVRSNNDFDMDQKIESTLVGIAISTGRGILFEKASGTIMEKFIIPIVNPMDLILSKKFKKPKQIDKKK